MREDFLAKYRGQRKPLGTPSGFTWEELSPEMKKGIGEPPKFEDFAGDQEAFEYARVGWARSALPVLRLRMARGDKPTDLAI